MFWNWWKQQNLRDFVGLEIGLESIKLLKINTSEKPNRVETFLTAEIPAGAVNKNQLVDYFAIATVLKNMYKKAEIKSKSVVMAIHLSTAMIKNITLDNRLTADEIEARTWIEANRYFPDLVGDIYLDFTVVGPSIKDSSQVEVILVACRKDQIKPYLEICKLAGLTPKAIDVNSYALERALLRMVSAQREMNTYGILNLNLDLSTFVVIKKDSLLYAHEQTFEGQRLMSQVKEYFKNPKNDANYTQLLKETLSAHLRHTMHFFYSNRPNMGIGHLIISGDCATIPELALFVQQEMRIPSSIADPFTHWSIAQEIDAEELKQNAPTLVLCYGLALVESEQLK